MSIYQTSPTFDRIAAGWYGFRHRTIFKTELDSLARRWEKGKLLNLGCGHGADFLPFKDSFDLTGIDISSEMLKFAEKFMRKHGFQADLKQADMRLIPYRDASFDFELAVASLHHIDDKPGREKAAREMFRVLKPGGEAFITVWNAFQPRFIFRNRDVHIPWRAKDEVIERFYHLFSYRELEKLFESAGFRIISSRPESTYHLPVKYFSRNICLLVQKP
ncbi:Methyltransferase domain-containing protein [Dehalogenimonas formicexedens]|uniref:Methyltransferase domain-containing protein n=2 Tax=Dehalogenimonas formicexedens TaxID=1839801 RepID=A0A1P8F725_9CHLR|nr:Methyltransferase domain-containing protein [Dehalogenimonas formicexedens]